MTTRKQDELFIKELIPDTLLELAIDWLQKNMEPEDVFTEAQLENWAKSNGFVDEDSV